MKILERLPSGLRSLLLFCHGLNHRVTERCWGLVRSYSIIWTLYLDFWLFELQFLSVRVLFVFCLSKLRNRSSNRHTKHEWTILLSSFNCLTTVTAFCPDTGRLQSWVHSAWRKMMHRSCCCPANTLLILIILYRECWWVAIACRTFKWPKT